MIPPLFSNPAPIQMGKTTEVVRVAKVSTLVLLTCVLHFLLGKFLDPVIEVEIICETDLIEEVLDSFTLAIFEVGAPLLQTFVRLLHGEHGRDEAGARVNGSGKS